MYIFFIIIGCLIYWTIGMFFTGYVLYKLDGPSKENISYILIWIVWPIILLSIALIEIFTILEIISNYLNSKKIISIISYPVTIWGKQKDVKNPS